MGLFDGITGWVGGLFENDGKNETDTGFDWYAPNGKRRDESAVDAGFSEDLAGELTRNDDGTLHYKGELGEFDYDASQWAVCLHENGDGERSAVLRYIGQETDGAQIDVPDGVVKLDHAFANLAGLASRPEIPASVVSMTGAFNGCTGLAGLAGAVKTDIDTSQGSDVTAEGKIDSDEELLARETGIGTKSTEYGNIEYNLFNDGGKTRSDEAAAGAGYSEALGGEVTRNEDGTLHYSGYLGDFDYDTDDWAVGTRTVVTEDGYSASVPVLRYVGSSSIVEGMGDFFTNGSEADRIRIPEGVRVLDFAFEGNEKLTEVPVIPEGVESAHCAFANCTKLEKACEAAKDGDAQGEAAGSVAAGSVGVAVGTAGVKVCAAAGGKIGATIGSIGGPAGAAIGTGIGVVIGGIGGFIAGKTAHGALDGKGGDWYLPSSLKDTSYMFDGCTKLTEAAQFSDESALMNTQGMYRNNDALGSDPVANKYGSKAISDLSGTLVTTDSNSHMYEGTNTDYTMTPETKDKSSSRYWNDETGQFEEGVYETHGKDDVKAAEGLSTNMEVEAVLDADVVTDLDVASGGSASTGFYYNRHGEKVETTDANAQNQIDREGGTGMGGLMSLLDRGLVSFAEYKLLGMFTGANKGIGGKLLAAGGAAALQLGGVLPKSMKPIIEGVANMVGPDTQIGGLLNSVAGMLPDVGDNSLVAKALGTDQLAGVDGTHAEKIDMLTEEQKAQKDDSDKTLGSLSGRMEMVLDNPFGADSDDKLTILDGDRINAYMDVNARQMAQDNIFLTAANKSMDDAEFGEMGAMMELSGDALEEQAALWAQEDGGQLSEEHRQALSQAYMKMLGGLDAYDNAALDEIQALYADDPGKLAQAQNGLSKVMAASVTPAVESMMEMQAQYGIFTEEDLAKMDGMSFTGFNRETTAVRSDALVMDAADAKGWQETHGQEEQAGSAPEQEHWTGPEYQQVRQEAQPDGASETAPEEAAPVWQEAQEESQDKDPMDYVPEAAKLGGNYAAAKAAEPEEPAVAADAEASTEPTGAKDDGPELSDLVGTVKGTVASLSGLLALKKAKDATAAENAYGNTETKTAGREGIYTDEQMEAMADGAGTEQEYLPGRLGRRLSMFSET